MDICTTRCPTEIEGSFNVPGQEGLMSRRWWWEGQESQVLPRTMWGSHLSVTWEWFGAIGCYGHEYWAITSSPSLLFLKTAPGRVRISLDYAFGHLSFYNMTKYPIYTSPSIFFSETAHPLHSLVPEYRFSWHHSHIQGRFCNTSRENNLDSGCQD